MSGNKREMGYLGNRAMQWDGGRNVCTAGCGDLGYRDGREGEREGIQGSITSI